MNGENPGVKENPLGPEHPDQATRGNGPCRDGVGVVAGDGLLSASDAPVPAEGSAWSPGTAPFDALEKAWMLKAARAAIEHFVAGGDEPKLGEPPPRLTSKRGCFVTLTRAGALRGCIGNVIASLPLCQAVVENARAAASRDPRFPSVAPYELDDLRIEISVLTELEPLAFSSPEDLLGKLEPGVSGVVLRIDGLMSTFLPQVWAMVPDRTQFMNRLAEKAGYPPDTWREADVSVSLYKVECFEEEESPV
jgi:AmmeMemoRadiSam system protein A